MGLPKDEEALACSLPVARMSSGPNSADGHCDAENILREKTEPQRLCGWCLWLVSQGVAEGHTHCHWARAFVKKAAPGALRVLTGMDHSLAMPEARQLIDLLWAVPRTH